MREILRETKSSTLRFEEIAKQKYLLSSSRTDILYREQEIPKTYEGMETTTRLTSKKTTAREIKHWEKDFWEEKSVLTVCSSDRGRFSTVWLEGLTLELVTGSGRSQLPKHLLPSAPVRVLPTPAGPGPGAAHHHHLLLWALEPGSSRGSASLQPTPAQLGRRGRDRN